MTAVLAAPADLTRVFASMATQVTLRLVAPGSGAPAALDRAEDAVRLIASSCTRFDPASPLMRANAHPRRWHEVPAELFDALRAAEQAHRVTDGRFDPRILQALQAWGYDRSLPFRSGPVCTAGPDAPGGPAAIPRRRWRPRFDHDRRAVRIGSLPVDLGGIGKGFAVDRAAAALAEAGGSSLVEAGGDLYAHGSGPDGTGWAIGVEDPRGGSSPVAVLGLTDLACATSSIRLRHWTADGRTAHHLIDPRTGAPADGGLLSVTVVGPDVATAEVWSKALFIAGRGQVRRLADEHGLAALLVDTEGVVGLSRAMRPLVTWQAAPC